MAATQMLQEMLLLLQMLSVLILPLTKTTDAMANAGANIASVTSMAAPFACITTKTKTDTIAKI